MERKLQVIVWALLGIGQFMLVIAAAYGGGAMAFFIVLGVCLLIDGLIAALAYSDA